MPRGKTSFPPLYFAYTVVSARVVEPTVGRGWGCNTVSGIALLRRNGAAVTGVQRIAAPVPRIAESGVLLGAWDHVTPFPAPLELGSPVTPREGLHVREHLVSSGNGQCLYIGRFRGSNQSQRNR